MSTQGGTYPPKRFDSGRRSTSVLAVATLTLGVVAAAAMLSGTRLIDGETLLGAAIVTILCGILALIDIHRRRHRGTAIAIAGLLLGMFALLQDGPQRDASGAIVEAGRVATNDRKPGDCFNGLGELGPGANSMFSIDAAPCAEAHQAEVFAVFELTGTSYPGHRKVSDEAWARCRIELDRYSQHAAEDPSVRTYSFFPTEGAWNGRSHNREVICIIGNPAQSRTGSMRD